MSGNSIVKESQPSVCVHMLGISRQVVEIILGAHHVFAGIESFWQAAFALVCARKGSREAVRLTVLSLLGFGEKLAVSFCPALAKDLVRIQSGVLVWRKTKNLENRSKLQGHGVCSVEENRRGDVTGSVNMRSRYNDDQSK